MDWEKIEWDEAKARSNSVKHRISFVGAATVFLDPQSYTRLMTNSDYGEERFKIIGSVGEEIIAVIYTIRGSKYRIISARSASRGERRAYHRSSASS